MHVRRIWKLSKWLSCSLVPLTFVLNSSWAAAAATEPSTAVLSIGRSTEWPAPGGAAVSVSNGAIVKVADLGSKLKIVAHKVGVALIRVGGATLTVHVLPEPERRLYDQLHEVISTMRGLEIKIDGHSLTLEGRLLRFDDWFAIGQACASASAHFTFHATMSPAISAKARTFFRKLLRDSHLPDLPLELEPAALAIIPLDPPDLKLRAERVLSPYGFRVDVSPAALSLEPMVRVRVIIAEVRKNAETKIGIEWPDSAQAHLLPTLGAPADLSVTLHALESNGAAKILASPTLLCRSGKEAQFLAGGEFPIKIINFKIQDIIWKQYGVMLKIHPKADFSGRMSIALETEISDIDGAHTVDGIPGINTNRIESHFDLTSSRTIVLSGLIKKKTEDFSSGLPGLSNLPILGALFSSKDFREQRSELIVFVTPELARPDQEEM